MLENSRRNKKNNCEKTDCAGRIYRMCHQKCKSLLVFVAT